MKTYTAKVHGVIFNGSRASTSYAFHFHPTREQIIERAADFQRVTAIQLTRTETVITQVSPLKSASPALSALESRLDAARA